MKNRHEKLLGKHRKTLKSDLLAVKLMYRCMMQENILIRTSIKDECIHWINARVVPYLLSSTEAYIQYKIRLMKQNQTLFCRRKLKQLRIQQKREEQKAQKKHSGYT